MDIFNAVSKQMDTSDVSDVKQAKPTSQIKSIEQTAKQQIKEDKKEIEQQLKDTVKNLNRQMDALNTNITFGFNDKLSSMYVDVTEKSTGKLIRKFPSEEAMKLAEHFQEIIGIIFDEKG